VKLFNRTPDRVDVPTRSLPLGTPDFRAALLTGILAMLCLVVVADIGNAHARELHARLIVIGGTLVFIVLGALSVRSVGNETQRILSPRVGPTHASAVRLLIILFGAAVVLFASLGLLAVPIGHLLLGGAITGVIVGIAAQQSLGNVFAGVILLLARPFNINDDIRIRSSALGGEILGAVTGMGLTYVTLDTTEGALAVPNSTLLAAAIGPASAPGSTAYPVQRLSVPQ
jgi:small-conductance mechanosensitive channel